MGAGAGTLCFPSVREKITVFSSNWFESGEGFLLTVGVLLLTVELLCLQSVEALFRHTFPL